MNVSLLKMNEVLKIMEISDTEQMLNVFNLCESGSVFTWYKHPLSRKSIKLPQSYTIIPVNTEPDNSIMTILTVDLWPWVASKVSSIYEELISKTSYIHSNMLLISNMTCFPIKPDQEY